LPSVSEISCFRDVRLAIGGGLIQDMNSNGGFRRQLKQTFTNRMSQHQVQPVIRGAPD